MNRWTSRRKASLFVHSTIVLIPLVFGTISALLFWQSLFQSWLIAGAMVGVIDVLALTGLVLFICRIASPFAVLRHALPFVSIVPLGVELWRLLTPHNDIWVTAVIAVLATGILVAVAWRCYVTIEQLFVDPVTAAAELMKERATAACQQMTQQVQALTTTLSALSAMETMAVEAVQEWSRRPQLLLTSAQPVLTGPAEPTVTTQQVKAYAAKVGVSERTVWRRLEKRELSAADIVVDEREED